MNEKVMFDKEFAKQFDFIEKLADEERSHFLETTSYRRVNAGEIIANENGSCMGVAFVLSGELKMFKVSDGGREISLYTAKAGEVCIMTVACLMGQGRSISPVSVVALQDSLLAVVPCSAFRYHYTNSPYLQQFFFKNTLEKFYELMELVERLTFKSVAERLWEHILANTEKGKKPLYSTHAQLAAKLGTSREVVTRKLHELENAGFIKTERGKLTLIKPDADLNSINSNHKSKS